MTDSARTGKNTYLNALSQKELTGWSLVAFFVLRFFISLFRSSVMPGEAPKPKDLSEPARVLTKRTDSHPPADPESIRDKPPPDRSKKCASRLVRSKPSRCAIEDNKPASDSCGKLAYLRRISILRVYYLFFLLCKSAVFSFIIPSRFSSARIISSIMAALVESATRDSFS